MNLDGALQTFFAEADDLLNSMEAALLRLDEGEPFKVLGTRLPKSAVSG